MIEAETIDYIIATIGMALLFVGFVVIIGAWFFSWYDDYMNRPE